MNERTNLQIHSDIKLGSRSGGGEYLRIKSCIVCDNFSFLQERSSFDARGKQPSFDDKEVKLLQEVFDREQKELQDVLDRERQRYLDEQRRIQEEQNQQQEWLQRQKEREHERREDVLESLANKAKQAEVPKQEMTSKVCRSSLLHILDELSESGLASTQG